MNAQVADVQLGLDAQQFREYIIRPALERIDLWSRASENLVLGTGIHESRLRWIDQLAPGPGPAYGPFQMERPTYGDLWRNYISGVPDLRSKLIDIAGWDSLEYPPVTELHGNLFFAAAMCRVHYRRVKEALPAENDAAGMASYWKRYYNTVLGKGTVEQALPAFRVACGVRA